MSEVSEGGEPGSRALENKNENCFSFGGTEVRASDKPGTETVPALTPLAGLGGPSSALFWLSRDSLRVLRMQSCGHQRALTHEMKTLAILIWVKPPSLADDDPGCGVGLCSTAPCLEPSWRSTKCHLIVCDPKSAGAALPLPLPLRTQPLQPRRTGGCRKRRARADARLPPAFSVSSESPLPAARGHCQSEHLRRQPLGPLPPTFAQAWVQPPLLHSPKRPTYRAFGRDRGIFLQRTKRNLKLGTENYLSLECVGPLSQQRDPLRFSWEILLSLSFSPQNHNYFGAASLRRDVGSPGTLMEPTPSQNPPHTFALAVPTA